MVVSLLPSGSRLRVGRRDYPLPRFICPEPVLLVGQGGPLARALPAGKLVATLVEETDAALARLS